MGLALVLWLAVGTPPAIAAARLEGRPSLGALLALAGPIAWVALVLARRHDEAQRLAAVAHRLAGRV